MIVDSPAAVDVLFDRFLKELHYVAAHNSRLFASEEWRVRIAEEIVRLVSERDETGADMANDLLALSDAIRAGA
jgi:hypothetical protein